MLILHREIVHSLLPKELHARLVVHHHVMLRIILLFVIMVIGSPLIVLVSMDVESLIQAIFVLLLPQAYRQCAPMDSLREVAVVTVHLALRYPKVVQLHFKVVAVITLMQYRIHYRFLGVLHVSLLTINQP